MGRLVVLAAPSGGGKTTLSRKIVETIPNIEISISYTTRAMRDGETDGVHYYFITKDEFKKKIDEGDFVEYAEVHEKFYGTSISKLKEITDAGKHVFLDIDVQGAEQIKKKFPNAILIFILPPNFNVLKQRLAGRKTESDDQIKLRLKDAQKELEEVHSYDYIVVNDKLEKAAEEIKSVIIAEELKVSENKDFIDSFISDIKL
jgi:guanylate kinase